MSEDGNIGGIDLIGGLGNLDLHGLYLTTKLKEKMAKNSREYDKEMGRLGRFGLWLYKRHLKGKGYENTVGILEALHRAGYLKEAGIGDYRDYIYNPESFSFQLTTDLNKTIADFFRMYGIKENEKGVLVKKRDGKFSRINKKLNERYKSVLQKVIDEYKLVNQLFYLTYQNDKRRIEERRRPPSPPPTSPGGNPPQQGGGLGEKIDKYILHNKYLSPGYWLGAHG
jgi:hypothetical protein